MPQLLEDGVSLISFSLPEIEIREQILCLLISDGMIGELIRHVSRANRVV